MDVPYVPAPHPLQALAFAAAKVPAAQIVQAVAEPSPYVPAGHGVQPLVVDAGTQYVPGPQQR